MSIRAIQTKLNAAGFDPGPIDGLWGARSEAALDAALAAAQALMLSPVTQVAREAIAPALLMLPPRMSSPEARLIMLAICGQEADFHHRWQVVDRSRPGAMGPARGLWQFERGGGVRGVLTHPASRPHAEALCAMRRVPAAIDAVYNTLHVDDVLAAGFARLLLWTDPAPLPAVGDVEAAWKLYLRTWRPGVYTRGTEDQRSKLRAKWAGYYNDARMTL